MTRIAVDTGGTFTDLVRWDGDRVRVAKVLSTPDDPARAVVAGLARLADEGDGDGLAGEVVHGSTVATNAVLERRGARTALVTNRGFEDLLSIGRQSRPELYALRVEREPPLVPPEQCFGVGGRLSADGQVLEPLDDAEVERLVGSLAGCAPEAVAICLLHSYANPVHEAALAEALRRALPDAPVTASHQVLPQFREVERAAAAVLNAYVTPRMARYLLRLRGAVPGALWIMRSDGGLASAEEAAERPVHTLLSGPAGGVVGALEAGRSAGFERLVSFDMGGTSTDVSLIDGRPTLTRESRFGGLPLAVTTLDIHTVGAGGGSIAWIDAGGALKVGPHSAGAHPGPACYGAGTEPAVTDAQVVLGRLPAGRFLGGEMVLHAERARAAVGDLGERLGLTLEETARGIIAVANAHMARAIKVISLERGHDPRHFALVAFGGAGGLHACELAESLGMEAVLVPPQPGLLSAVGMLSAPVTRELAASVLEPVTVEAPWSDERVSRVVAPLLRQAEAFLDAHGMAAAERRVERLFDLRYRGQSFELTVHADDDQGQRGVPRAFHALHEQRYGYQMPDRPLEWVSVRVRAHGLRPRPAQPGGDEAAAGRRPGHPAPDTSGPHPVWRREDLAGGTRLQGPAVISEYSATTWLPAGWTAEVLADGAMALTMALTTRPGSGPAQPETAP